MLTDWLLIRRIAFEIESRLRGGRVRDVGLLGDGRIGIAIWTRGNTQVLALDVFGTPPLVTLERGELPIGSEHGFVRALGAALRGTTLLSAKSRTGDRLLRLTFGTRSRFGVGDEVDVFVELVPRFGNVVLVKGDIVVAAAKEFSLAENPERAVSAGMRYQPPPARVRPALVEGISEDALREPAYVYLRGGTIVQVYLAPLQSLAEDVCERRESVLEVLAAYREQNIGAGERARTARRRTAAHKRLERRDRKLRDELASVRVKRDRANEREALREEGDAIYATLHEREGAPATDEAKERAAKLFAQYKKLGASIPHLDAREAALRVQLDAIEELRWEVDRADDADLEDVEAALDTIDPRARSASVSRKRRKRLPLEIRTPSGSRILVGRSPSENAELTFHVARPNDLWFHAQRVPGAHVILQRDDRDEPSSDDIARAAALAAHHSKAQAGGAIPVDYTQRKHVRKQKDAPPGLVWYTNFKTVVASPQDP